MKPESVILKEVMLEASKCGLRVFRNHVGGFYAKDGSYHKTGLCKGSSDLIGWQTGTGRFVAIEVKRQGSKASKEQIVFLENVKKSGGIALIVSCAKKIQKMLDEYNLNN